MLRMGQAPQPSGIATARLVKKAYLESLNRVVLLVKHRVKVVSAMGEKCAATYQFVGLPTFLHMSAEHMQ